MKSPSPTEKYKFEEIFHDNKAEKGVNDFYSFGALDNADEYLWRQLGNLKGKRILEIGCGDGTSTLRFAKEGATVVAIDISKGMVDLTQGIVEKNGYSKSVQTIHLKGEDINFDPEFFDIIYGHSVLHHMDIEKFGPACARVLRKGGVACFLEPLDYNPVLSLFRLFTPQRRTPTEQPLRMRQLDSLGKYFKNWEHEEFSFLALFSFIWYYGIRNRNLFQATLKYLGSIDNRLFKLFPALRRLAWVTVVRFEK